jgi:hypothetical protein
VSTSDPLDELEAMVEGLDIASHLRDFHALTNAELVRRYNTVKEDLKNRGELVEPRTDTGKDLHSQHTALLNELHERHMR